MGKLHIWRNLLHHRWLWLAVAGTGILTLAAASSAAFLPPSRLSAHIYTPHATTSTRRIATSSKPSPSPSPSPSSSASPAPTVLGASSNTTPTPTATPVVFPLHQNIIATYFYGGEDASSDNNWQTNTQTAWCDDWAHCFGGTDTPNARQHNGDWPAAFKPKENPFYVALPCSDFGANGLRPDFQQFAATSSWLKLLTHNAPITSTTSVLKNRWIKLTAGSQTVYGQWEDTGPFANASDNDCQYVFGNASAKPDNQFGEQAGIDVSPAIELRLHLTGANPLTWQFVDASQVPSGPWTEITTTSGPYWP